MAGWGEVLSLVATGSCICFTQSDRIGSVVEPGLVENSLEQVPLVGPVSGLLEGNPLAAAVVVVADTPAARLVVVEGTPAGAEGTPAARLVVVAGTPAGSEGTLAVIEGNSADPEPRQLSYFPRMLWQ